MKFTEFGILLVFSFISSNIGCQTEWSPLHRSRNYPNTRIQQQQHQQLQQSQTTRVQQKKVQNNQEIKAEIKKREYPQDFGQLLRIWQQLQDRQVRNSQFNPDEAETQSNHHVVRVRSDPDDEPQRDRNSRRNKNYGWSHDIEDSGSGSDTSSVSTDYPKTDHGEYGHVNECKLKATKENPKKFYYDCQVNRDRGAMTIKKTHDLWLNPFTDEVDVDIKVPNYKIHEIINAHVNDSAVRQNITLWVKKPEWESEAATAMPKIVSDTNVQVKYEKIPAPRSIHYSNSGKKGSVRYSERDPAKPIEV